MHKRTRFSAWELTLYSEFRKYVSRYINSPAMLSRTSTSSTRCNVSQMQFELKNPDRIAACCFSWRWRERSHGVSIALFHSATLHSISKRLYNVSLYVLRISYFSTWSFLSFIGIASSETGEKLCWKLMWALQYVQKNSSRILMKVVNNFSCKTTTYESEQLYKTMKEMI